VRRWFAWALLALPIGARAQAATGDNLQVFLLTMGAGADIYERFGHNAIWVRDTLAHTDLIYNYGAFEFPNGLGDELAFAGRFAMGRPRYWLGVDSSMEHTLAEYRVRQRDLSAQELDLTPAQRADIAARLARNALPENKVYTYDYFRDNCSTRVRDMLDAVLGGALARATRDRPGAGSLRFHTLRSITNDKLLFLGIDASFGPPADRRIDQWEEMFLPQKVQQRIRELHVRTPDGQDVPLVKLEFPVLTIGRYRVEPAPPHWLAAFALIGVAVGAVLLLGTVRGTAGIVGRVLVTAWLLLTGLGGLLLLFFWLFTDQFATYANHNLLFLSPLALGVVPSVWYRGMAPARRWRARLIGLLALSIVLGVGLTIVPIVTRQDNLEIAALTVLPTLAALWVVATRLRPADVDRTAAGAG
jgi:hypothetical protein